MNYSRNYYKYSIILLLMMTIYISILSSINFIPLFLVEKIKFCVLLFLAFMNWKETRQLTLFQVWIAGYIFIIQSDIMISLNNSHNADEAVNNAVIYLSIANELVLLGYYCVTRKKTIETNGLLKLKNVCIKNELLFVMILVFFSILYFFERFQSALMMYYYGRKLVDAKGGGSLYSYFISAVGGVIPCLISYYLYRIKSFKTFIPLLLCIPFFIVSFMEGTRFKLLFVVLPPLIVLDWIDINRLYGRRLIYVLFISFFFIMSSSFIKEYRNFSLRGEVHDNNIGKKDVPLSVKLSMSMSPEGIVRMIILQDKWFENNPRSYGRESATPLYFWIPRTFWNDKPTQLDYWLIRKYERVSDAHSTASGFAGELKADFGLFSLLILFFWGVLLRKLDSYIHHTLYNNSNDVILISLLVPSVFFFVRSPITTFVGMIFQVVLFYLVKWCFLSKINK